ncbi:MAG: phosphoenolpyruvate--protein phosphotransferase, partial [Mycobacterium sp.]
MTSSSVPASPAQVSAVLSGVPVVPGVAYAPVIRAGEKVPVDQLAVQPDVDEAARPVEVGKFTAAATA